MVLGGKDPRVENAQSLDTDPFAQRLIVDHYNTGPTRLAHSTIPCITWPPQRYGDRKGHSDESRGIAVYNTCMNNSKQESF